MFVYHFAAQILMFAAFWAENRDDLWHRFKQSQQTAAPRFGQLIADQKNVGKVLVGLAPQTGKQDLFQ